MNENGENNPICVEDFCGYSSIGHFPVQYWADWYPQTKFCHFGGDWNEVKPRYFEKCPTLEEVKDYANSEINKIIEKEKNNEYPNKKAIE